MENLPNVTVSTIDPEIVAASETAVLVSVPNIPSNHRGSFTIHRDNGAKYSPEEWELRNRNGILSNALRENRQRRHSFTNASTKGKETMEGSRIIDGQRRRITIVDSSDEEYRYGILGKSLERIRLKSKNKTNSEDEEIKSGDFKIGIFSGSDDNLEAIGLSNKRESYGFEDDVVFGQRKQNFSEEEMREIAELESLQIHGGDNSTGLLLAAKKGEWETVKNLLLSGEIFDLTLADAEG
ncbi:unnamed protein product [Meloidogyne enterolobii]|uniref:Uncharacterized protein n=1 Tax=Meloidogyne enterolobii TaxID=390850 RepID=A0ACB0YWB3_MELEN